MAATSLDPGGGKGIGYQLPLQNNQLEYCFILVDIIDDYRLLECGRNVGKRDAATRDPMLLGKMGVGTR